MRAQVACIVQSRPDISCADALHAKIPEKLFVPDSRNNVKELNAIIRHLKKTPDTFLRYSMLDRESMRVQLYFDASYGLNVDGSSQLGHI